MQVALRTHTTHFQRSNPLATSMHKRVVLHVYFFKLQTFIGQTRRNPLKNKILKIAEEMKILGTTFSNSLSWDSNTEDLVRRVNKYMLLLKKIRSFGALTADMVDLWKTYCRPILVQSAVV